MVYVSMWDGLLENEQVQYEALSFLWERKSKGSMSIPMYRRHVTEVTRAMSLTESGE